MDTAATVTRFVIDELLAGEDVGGLDPEYDLVANGVIDSLGVIQLVGWLNDAFGISVEDVDMTDFESINAICALVANAPHLTR